MADIEIGKDPLLEQLREARLLAIDIEEDDGSDRALSLVLTKIEEAILWREQGLRWKGGI